MSLTEWISICHYEMKRRLEPKHTPQLFLGSFFGDAPVSDWPFFFLVTVPEAFAKVNSNQSPSNF